MERAKETQKEQIQKLWEAAPTSRPGGTEEQLAVLGTDQRVLISHGLEEGPCIAETLKCKEGHRGHLQAGADLQKGTGGCSGSTGVKY